MTNCNEINIEAERLKSIFGKCYNLKAIDLRDIVDLIESVNACANGTFELKTINGQSLIGPGNIEITADVDGTETKIIDGAGISVTGSGSISSPYVITSDITQTDGSETKLLPGANISIMGSGTIANPYTINASIPASEEQVNADWASTSGKSLILNKPEIPSPQVNADWNAVSGITMILNKPNTLNTNLSYVPNEFGGTINSSNGTSASIPLVTEEFPGLVSKTMLDSLGGDLDNIKIEIEIEAPEVETNVEFVKKINEGPFVDISGNQIPTFKAIKVNEDGTTIFYVEILGRGKGGYGVDGYQLSPEEIRVTSFQLLGSDIEKEATTQVIDLGTNPLDVVTTINSRIPNIVIQNQEDGYVLIKGYFDTNVYKEYLWIGSGGIYGGEVGAGQATYFDLKELSKEAVSKASMFESGTVKTNLTVSDPVVYLKETSDQLLLLKENLSNKAINFDIKNDLLYPTTKAVDDHVDLSIYNHKLVNNNSSTGLVDGAAISIMSASTVNISPGYGVVVDNTTNPQSPVLTRVSWGAFTGVTISNLATKPGTAFFITKLGALVQQDVSTMSNSSDIRSMIYIGSVGHPNGVAINVFGNPMAITNPASNLSDLFSSIGPFSISGNKLKKITGTLTLLKTAGKSYFANANYQANKTSPNIFITPTFNGGILSHVKSTAFLGPVSASIDSDRWDNLGTLTNLGGNNFAAHRIWHQPSANLIFFQYGQAEYTSLSLAKSGFINEDFIVPSPLEFGAYLIAVILVKKGETNLDNPLNSEIIPQSKFSGTGSGGGGIVPTLQLAYEGSVQPQIETNAGKGSLVLKRGSLLDTDNVLEIHNGSGVATSTIKGNGEITALSYNGYTPENNANKAINFSVSNNILYPTVQAVKNYADSLVVGLLDDRGSYDASSNLYPTTGGSGAAGAILKGDIWYISVAGVLSGINVKIGDSFRAISDAPGQTASKWSLLSSNLGYVPANAARNIITNSPLQGGGNLSSDITLSIQQATSSINGYLSSNDWNIFDNKQDNIGYIPANDLDVVHKTGNETIAGTKTFNSSTLYSNSSMSTSPSAAALGRLGNDIAVGSTGSAFFAKFATNILSATQTYTFPNKTGVFAMISDLSAYEPTISPKNTAFNKNFGTTAGTVAEGNDSRILNGQTAFGWGNHSTFGYALDSNVLHRTGNENIFTSSLTWPNATNSDSNNYINNKSLAFKAGNNGMYVIGDTLSNSRRFGFQVGHGTSTFASTVGTLELNPFGGSVVVNGVPFIGSNITNWNTAYGWSDSKGRYLSNKISDLGYTELYSGDLDALPTGSYIQAISGSATNPPASIGAARSLISFGGRLSSDSPLQSDVIIGVEGAVFRNRTNNIWRRLWTNSDFSSVNINNWNTAYSWGNHAGLYQPVENQRLSTTNSPTFKGIGVSDVFSSFLRENSVVFTRAGLSYIDNSGIGGSLAFRTSVAAQFDRNALILNNNGSANFYSTVSATTFIGALTGNASSATALQNSRTIFGQPFNGTANVAGAVTATTGNFSSTITASPATVDTELATLGQAKAVLNNATLTGTPTAPTAAAGTNTTQIATTAFVTSADSGNVKLTGNQNISGSKIFETGSNSVAISINNTGSSAQGFRITNSSTGAGMISYGLTGSTGDVYQGGLNAVATFRVNKEGDITGNKLTLTGVLKLKAYTVGSLPTGAVGDMAYVTDATAPTYNGTLTGGGSVVCPVFYNGTAWVSH